MNSRANLGRVYRLLISSVLENRLLFKADELLTLLEQREPDELNERLIDELHKSALKIYPDNTARIGGWKLIVRGQALLLQCLAVLHENFRLYYEADLAVKGEHWQAVQIRSVMVKRHGL